MKQLRQLLNLLSMPVYLCIVLYLLIAFPMVLGYKPVVVLSGSMEPTYHVGSILYYKQASFEEIEAGDVITYHAGEDGAMVTHRVVEKREPEEEFVTRGDANNTPDPNPVPYERVSGRAASLSLPYAGSFIEWTRKPTVLGCMALILVAGILLDRENRPDGKNGGCL